MKRPKKQREHRVGSGFKPEVLDSALLHLEQRTLLPQSQLEAESHPVAESSVAKERVKAAQAAYKADPSDANRHELNAAHKDLRTSLEVELTTMDPSKAFQVSKQKALSLRAKADDVMKLIRNTKFERNDAQMKADGMGVIRVDQKRAKLEAQYAMLVDEMRFYQTMMGAVYKRNDFSESEDFAQLCARTDGSVYGTAGQCRKGKEIADNKPSRQINKKFLREAQTKDIGRYLNEKQLYKYQRERLLSELVRRKNGPTLKSAEQVAKEANLNAERVVKQEKGKNPQDAQGKAAAAKRAGQAAAKEDIVKRGQDKPADRGAQAKAKGAGEVRAERSGDTTAARNELKGLLKERLALEKRAAKAADLNQLTSIGKREKELEEQIESLAVRANPDLKLAYAVDRAARKAAMEAEQRGDREAFIKAEVDGAVARQRIKNFQREFLEGKKAGEQVISSDETGFPKVSGVKGYDPIKDYKAPGGKILGSGAMGEVVKTKGPPPGIVKKGAIGENEAKALKILEGTGVAPTFHGQKLTGKAQELDVGLGGHVREAQGYLAMSKAPGEPLGSQAAVFSPWRSEGKRQLEEMTDAYISARATIHRAGVAHNDMHSHNFFYDQSTKKGTLVDFGLSQVDSRAALMEGLGLGTGGKGSGRSYSFGSNEGDWQASRVKNQLKVASTQSGKFARYMENRDRVLEVMRRENPSAHREYQNGGIRVDKSILDDSGLDEKQAKRYIDMLYEGID